MTAGKEGCKMIDPDVNYKIRLLKLFDQSNKKYK